MGIKEIVFAIFGIGCKFTFHLLSFIATYFYCKKVFVVLMCIWVAHNIVSICWLLYRKKKGKKQKGEE